MPVSFFDTNILVYLASADSAKADRAEQVLAGGGTISVQVLNELATIARRKMHLSWTETTDLLATIRALVAVVPLTIETHEAGLSLARRFGLSIHDAMIAASAMLSGCDTLWSEDMQHGMALDNGLRIRNPFRPD
jgi:predicted nucleic acid-binding protein